jgi:AcrR family transcriptional regulator
VSNRSVATAPRRIYRSHKQAQRDANILAVTRTALAERGYDGVTMSALADEAGVTKRTLYNLYGGKDQLLHAAVGEVIARYRGGESTVEPGIDTIISSRRTAVDEVLATPEYSDAMTRALVQASPEHPLTQALLRDSLDFTNEHLHVAKRNGALICATPVNDLAQQIVSQGWGMVLLRMKGLVETDAFRRASMQGLLMLLRGYAGSGLRERIDAELTKDQD